MKIILRAPGAAFRRTLIHILFYFAAVCLFASLATAPGQLYLGKLYYIKDAGVSLSFLILAALATQRNDKMAMLLVAAATVLMFVFIPALPKDETLATGVTIMWILKWTVAAQLGILAFHERLERPLAIAMAVLICIFCIDGLIGLWEIRTQGYYFDVSSLDEAATGGAGMRIEAFEDLIRIHALHRSSGDFGNSMALAMIVSTFVAFAARRKAARLAMVPLFALCAYDLFFSTLRSFLVGAAAGVLALVFAMFLRRWFHRHLVFISIALIFTCLFFSYYNIIPTVEFVSKHFLSNFQIGNVNSSYERLDSWDDVFANIHAAPIVALIGGPLAAAFSVDTPPSNICDNIYLWIFYHLGIFGLAGFIAAIPFPLIARTDPRVRALYFASATQLLVTGIFTDSLFYFSSLTLFFALGLILAERHSRPAPIFLPGEPEAAAAPAGKEEMMNIEGAGGAQV